MKRTVQLSATGLLGEIKTMHSKTSYILVILSFLMTTFTFTESCTSKTDNENWKEIQSFINDTFRIDPSIKEHADLIMEGQEEVMTFEDLVKKDTTNKRKKSSNVKIIVLLDDMNDIEMTDELRCLANLKNDTLKIDISTNNGFSGKGISIKYTGQMLSTNIYEFTDVIGPSEKEPTYIIEKQKLALNKSKFIVGDSLYGHIYARIINDNKVKYYASGFFRAKITLRD